MAYIFPQKHILDNLFKIVQDFVEFIVVRNAQEEGIQSIQQNMGRVLFNREMNTLKLGLPRRSGNTTLALMIFQHYPSSILIVQNQHFIRELCGLCQLNSPSSEFFEAKERIFSKTQRIVGHSPSVVIVDTASYLTDREQENIFSIKSNAFIFLG
jgi:hypothetical protein